MLTIAKQLALVLILALALRLAAGWWWHSRLCGQFAFGDSLSYWLLAQTIADGRPYEHQAPEAKIFRTPGYPILLTPIFCLLGNDASVFWARAEGAVFGVLAILGVWWLAHDLFGARAGLLAAVVAGVEPGAIASSVLVLSEAPFIPLMLAQLILAIAAWKASSMRRSILLAVLAGIVAGMATLVRPSWLLFTPLAAAAALVASKERLRHLAFGAAMILGLIAAMLPWWIRNAQLTGHFVPTTLQIGASLYDGLNPAATGASQMDFVPAFVDAERHAPRATAAQPADTFEYRLDQRLREAALTWAREHPARALELAWVKLLRMWNFWPNERSFSTWPIRLTVAVSYLPLLVLGICGAWKTLDRGWPYVLLWLPAVYFTLLHVVFVSSIRYRQPPMMLLIVLAAGCFQQCLVDRGWWRANRDPPGH
jgi:4-amino-4-deoxy-L-arabinose transferase-like glycosyltransferase